MAKYKRQDQTEELERYLTNNFNLEIYEDLTEGDNAGLFEPVEFFRLLYAEYGFLEVLAAKPVTAVENLKKLEYTNDQKWVLLYYLCGLIENVNGLGDKAKDKRLDICRCLIVKERDRIAEELDSEEETEPHPVKENKFDFEGKVKPHLETLPDIDVQIKYLDEAATEYEQSKKPLFDGEWGEPTFAEKCRLEIQKLEREKKRQKASGSSPVGSKDKKEKRDKGGTQYQNLLAIHYLLWYAKANCHNTKKAKFASFLTGYSEESLRQQWSNIHRKADESGQIWEKAMETVRGYFEELGLPEVVKLIDNDLSSL